MNVDQQRQREIETLEGSICIEREQLVKLRTNSPGRGLHMSRLKTLLDELTAIKAR